jgi:hypothetical protein
MAGLLEGAMVIVLMTLLCCAGVAFYVRFLVALCKECRLDLVLRAPAAREEPNQDGFNAKGGSSASSGSVITRILYHLPVVER